MTIRRITFALAVVGMVLGVASGAEKVTLQPKYVPGEYVMETAIDNQTTMEMNGVKQAPQHMTQLMVATIRIDKPDAQGARKMHIHYRRIKQQVKMGAMTMAYDSAAAEKPTGQAATLAKVLQPLLKAKIVADISAEGKITKVSGLDSLWDELAKTAGPAAGPMLGQMKKSMGDKMIKGLFEKSSEMMPAGPVGVGQSWKPKLKMQMPMIGDADVAMDCTLKAIRGTVAVIDLKGHIKQAPGGGEISLMGQKVKISDMDLRQTGQLEVDTATGMVSNQVIDQDGTMSMTIEAQGGKKMSMKLTIKSKMNISTRKGTYKPEKPK